MLLSLDKGRGLGRGWWPIAMGGRLVDDGKRFDALGVALSKKNLYKGGGPGGGIVPGRG